jgi:hypothetical protein
MSSASNLVQFPEAARLTRRGMLQVGALGLGTWATAGLTLPRLLAADELARQSAALAAAGEPSSKRSGDNATADSCIVIFLNGGPSHLDMWDMKPEAPIEIRGEFRPIASSLPGVPVCEHLPRLAKWMHKATLVRSMRHSVNNAHAAAVYTALTGHDRGEIGGGAARSDHPPPGSVLMKLRPPTSGAVPYVTLPYKTKEGAGGPLQPGFLAGFIGQSYDPFWVLEDPNSPKFQVPNLTLTPGMPPQRVSSRRELLERLSTRLASRQNETGLAAIDKFQHQAFDLLASNKAQQAFQLHREPDSVRESYGRNIYGQSVLLARRLIEAGTRVVTMSWAPDANATWDTHGNNFGKLKNELLPQFDAASSSLLSDLHERGMLERTLVAVMGDFGRTPKINPAAGRDHWNSCYTIMLAGGGIKPGFVYGASDRTGSVPANSPVAPADVIATMYHLLGIDHEFHLRDQLDRPHQIVSQGSIVRDLLT